MVEEMLRADAALDIPSVGRFEKDSIDGARTVVDAFPERAKEMFLFWIFESFLRSGHRSMHADGGHVGEILPTRGSTNKHSLLRSLVRTSQSGCRNTKVLWK